MRYPFSVLLAVVWTTTQVFAAPPPALSPLSSTEAKKIQRAWAEHLGCPVEATNSLGMKFSLIPPGRFIMGSPRDEEWHREDEVQHSVELSQPYYLGATEVTQKQWKEVMGTDPSFCTGDDLPVDTVTWEEATEFCRKLGKREGKMYRLPTEAEWEYACRAGTLTPFHTGDTITPDQANYDGNRVYGDGPKGVFRETSTKAGSLPANAWGLHDMHGNLWEWCADWYGPYPQKDITDPRGPEKGERRITRGGCWVNFPAVCRSANRGNAEPVSWNFHFGFRVVQPLD